MQSDRSTQELAALDVAVETRDNEAIKRETPRVRQVLEEVFREFVSIVTVELQSGDIAFIEAYDVTHSVSGRQNKRSERVDTKSQGVNPSTNASNIKLSDYLNVVKGTHQSILSENVLEKIGETRNPAGYYTGKAKFSATDNTEATSGTEAEGATAFTLDSIPKKAQDYLRRVRGQTAAAIQQTLSMPFAARQEVLKPATGSKGRLKPLHSLQNRHLSSIVNSFLHDKRGRYAIILLCKCK